MGIGETFKNLIGLEDDAEDEITEEEIKKVKEEIAKETSTETREKTSFVPSFSQGNKREEKTTVAPERKYSMNSNNTTALKLLVIEPKNFEESKTLVDNLKAKKPVIVNLEKLETEVAKKIFDFLNGAVYALNGNVAKVTNNIFLFSPSNVGITESRDNRNVVPEEKSPWR